MRNYLFLPLLTLLAMPVYASKMPMPLDMPSSYEAECGSCHMAYPPGLLSEKSWQNVMAGLNKHFGSDASIDEKERIEITTWVKRNAATRQKYSELAPDNRITKTSWFERKHQKIKPDVWKRPSINSPANCGACHTQASAGIFSDKNIVIPAK